VTKLLVLGVAAAVIAGGVTWGIEFGARERSHAPTARHVRHFRDGPVHGLMLLPLADPDGHVPTASLDRSDSDSSGR
jgi:hypothetical protein